MVHKCPNNKAVISKGKLVKGCDICLPTKIQQGDTAKYYRREQQLKFRRDITQANQKEYVRAYGADAAREAGWSEEQIRKHI